MPRNENLNPRKTTTRRGPINQKQLKKYERGGGGRVMAQRDEHGNVHVWDGATRRQAAINTGRKLPARVYGPNEKLPEYVGGGCAVVTIALLTGAGGLGWAAFELVQRAAGA